jgi:CheY-like chemotaxis protein
MRKFNILIVDDEELLRNIMETILESEIEANFLKAQNGLEAQRIIEQNSEIDLIISDYTMPLQNGGDLYLFNCKLRNIPFILASGGSISDYPQFGNFKEKNSLNYFLEKPYDLDHLVEIVKNIINKSKLEISNLTNVENYDLKTNQRLYRIKLAHFMRYAINASDVYFSLAPDKYIKISDESPATSSGIDLLKHYYAKNIEYVYINKESFDSLIKYYSENIIVYQKPEETIKIAGQVFYLTMSSFENMGISEVNFSLTTAVIEETIKEISKSPKLTDQRKALFEDEGYLIGHSMLVMYIAGAIVSKTKLPFNLTMKKICTAAFIHDMSLEEDNLSTKEQSPDLVISKQEREKIISHPKESAKLVANLNEIIAEFPQSVPAQFPRKCTTC